MTRVPEDATVHYSKYVWRMRCDSCGFQDPEKFRGQPDLALFRDRGWFIAEKWGDCCPACVAAGKATAEPFPFREVAPA